MDNTIFFKLIPLLKILMNSIFKAILEENAITDKKMKKGLKRFIKYGMKLK